MELRLSRRLEAAAEYVGRCKCAADIGCDHGKLAAYLILNNCCERVLAADIRPIPLARAAELFAQLKIEGHAETILSDGFDKIDSCIDVAVIAGMGADNIENIIDRCEWIKNPQKRLVLVPASRHGRLREYLYRAGFCLIEETAVAECGHCYAVMNVKYCGEKKEISAGFAAVGLIGETAAGKDAEKYLVTALKQAQRARDGELLSLSPRQGRVDRLTETIEYIRSRT